MGKRVVFFPHSSNIEMKKSFWKGKQIYWAYTVKNGKMLYEKGKTLTQLPVGKIWR